MGNQRRDLVRYSSRATLPALFSCAVTVTLTYLNVHFAACRVYCPFWLSQWLCPACSESTLHPYPSRRRRLSSHSTGGTQPLSSSCLPMPNGVVKANGPAEGTNGVVTKGTRGTGNGIVSPQPPLTRKRARTSPQKPSDSEAIVAEAPAQGTPPPRCSESRRTSNASDAEREGRFVCCCRCLEQSMRALC